MPKNRGLSEPFPGPPTHNGAGKTRIGRHYREQRIFCQEAFGKILHATPASVRDLK
jgi:hypothetical protein